MSSLILISSIVGAILCISGIIWCVAYVHRALQARSRRLYVDAENVTLQEESAFGDAPSAQVRTGRGNNGPAYTPVYNGAQRPTHNVRDNYADRDAIEYRTEDRNLYSLNGGVRPASPNAECVEGIPIEARVRPRRNLPRDRIVVHHGGQDVYLDFRGVERVPQAGPPPLTLEEKQRLEDERNRIASPEFYGCSEYEGRRSSDTKTPNMRLSSSLLQELQLQYNMASAFGGAHKNYATDSSVGSMSFRPGSPAGSARRARHGWQTATPNSVSLQSGSMGGLQFLRRRKKSPTRHDAGSSTSPSQAPWHANSFASAPRNRREDLESTSDDFEDVSLHNGSAPPRLEQLREFLAKQEHQAPGQLSPTTGLGNVNGFDQISLHGTTPVFLDRQVSARASRASVSSVGHGGGCATDGIMASSYDQSVAPYPFHQSTVVAGFPPLNVSFHGHQPWRSTSVNSPVAGLADATPHPQLDSSLLPFDSHPVAERAAAGTPAGVEPLHPILSHTTAPAGTQHSVSIPVAAQGGGGGNAEAHASQVNTWSTSSNRLSSGLRSPFSLPGSDPVTASCSASSRGTKAQA
ncbi:hypothetical protein, conserved [Leishmania tarentolae]|uniref:Uncharacterized protein n=1 Tax=Leishmania tarentolae TaxID=5689 RepID=A0A640KN92_LEITA|nr:hypothetical protein, conserved [Leishmania tarentolae]